MNIFQKIKLSQGKIIFLVLIFTLGFFLRTYHFSDWLHFEIDQTYDTILVSQGIEKGIANLPLLGPTAGGGRALRLGPAFYYLEYLSARIFGNTPTGHAMLILITSLLAIPLFYLFLKKYFSTTISLLLLTIFSSSTYLVLYSRFSWSPNILPFFIILSFYFLLKSINRNEKKRDWWFLASVLSIAIITQIHFNAFFVVPPIVVFFLILKKPKFKIKTWLGAIAIFLIIYSPMIVNDLKTNGENLKFFEKKFTRTTRVNKHLGKILVRDIRFNALESLLVLTGQDEINGKAQARNQINHLKDLLINGRILQILSILIFFLAIYLLFRKTYFEKNENKKSFLQLISIWLGFSFFYYLALLHSGYRFYPRFFLLNTPLAFILLGLVFESIYPKKDRRQLVIIILISLTLVLLNLTELSKIFKNYSRAQTQPMKLETEDVFPNTNRLTLKQQLEIVDYIQSKYEKNHYPVYLKTLHEYAPAFWYHLRKRGIDYYAPINSQLIYQKGNYFMIYQSIKKKKPGKHFRLQARKVFGSLTVDYWKPKKNVAKALRQKRSQKEITNQMQKISEVYTWKKAFK